MRGQDTSARWHSLRVRSYVTLDNKVEGAVLVLMDIDALKHSEREAKATREYAENVVETLREPLLVLDRELRVESANRSFHRTFSVAPAETIGQFVFELAKHQWDIPRLRALLAEVLAQSASIEDFQIEYDVEHVGLRTMLLMPGPSQTRIEKPTGYCWLSRTSPSVNEPSRYCPPKSTSSKWPQSERGSRRCSNFCCARSRPNHQRKRTSRFIC